MFANTRNKKRNLIGPFGEESVMSIIKIIALTLIACHLGYCAADLAGGKPESFEKVSISDQLYDDGYERINEDLGKTAYVINHSGPIDKDSADLFLGKISVAVRDGDMIILRVESGGGETAACSLMYDAVQYAKSTGIKVISSTDYMSLSCGYMVSASADKIYAASGAKMGNIGVVIQTRNNSGELVTIGSTRVKEIMSGATIRDNSDLSHIQSMVNVAAKDFYNKITHNRGDRISNKGYAYSGHLFSGQHAIDIGIVDETLYSEIVIKKYYAMGYDVVEIKYTGD